MLGKIELAYPYSEDHKAGYVVTAKNGRKTLALVKKDGGRTSTQYARYLLAVHLGRYLKPEETVDHIDNVLTNNEISNLQILSWFDNTSKGSKKEPVFVDLKCPACEKSFKRTTIQLRGRKKKARDNMVTCSRICGGKLKFL